MTPFYLDPTIFNDGLYRRIQEIWLDGVQDWLPLRPNVAKRWFGPAGTERDAFDDVCRREFGQALESIGPNMFPIPSARPFLHQLHHILGTGTHINRLCRVHATPVCPWNQRFFVRRSNTARAALGMVILLDQIPRRIYRTREGMQMVYTHYDKISWSLVRDLFKLTAYPIDIKRPHENLDYCSPSTTGKLIWFYLPFMHSEEMAAHEQLKKLWNEYLDDLSVLQRSISGFLTQADQAIKGSQGDFGEVWQISATEPGLAQGEH